ncbi:hypothetical protein Micbo1qcDRAFT_160677 [Microdochium bolleyi]|uniref:Methyltransferase-domain-containing protein n=1 Tax=Microdochium bolleyi TaxID=196109 RepID=A0A136J6N5_9PEZI|nr:hypothetical protein Micbo1qcDRAFT_160677 [Microdochium bolleyi]
MAALTSRLTVLGDPADDDPEDILNSSLAAIYPDDIANTHGDDAHALSYASPHLPAPLLLRLADPRGEHHRSLFSHYLWNASLLLAELLEAATLRVPIGGGSGDGDGSDAGTDELQPGSSTRRGPSTGYLESFDVRGLRCAELGAGTALPSLMAALLGAGHVTITDYPSPEFLETVRHNVEANVQEDKSPLFFSAAAKTTTNGAQSQGGVVPAAAVAPERTKGVAVGEGRRLAEVEILGHEWGKLPVEDGSDRGDHRPGEAGDVETVSPRQADNTSSGSDTVEMPIPSGSAGPLLLPQHRHAYDRVLAADCLWMPSQHANLAASISFLLRRPQARSRRVELDPQVQRQSPSSLGEEEAQAWAPSHHASSDDHGTESMGNHNGEDEDDSSGGGRALLVAGFHTGRQGMRGFLFSPPLPAPLPPPPPSSSPSLSPFSSSSTSTPPQQPQPLQPSPHLLRNNLAVESVHERDCDGNTRPWAWDRGYEDPSERKRWLVVAVLKPTTTAAIAGAGAVTGAEE